MILHSRSRLCALLLATSLLGACAIPGQLQRARDQYYSGQPEAALATLDEKELSGRNRLLGQLDAGLIAHMDGQYARSRDAFLAATQTIEELDKISVSEQTSALLISDWATRYRGEYSERLWVHSFQMMNFLLLGDPEGAAVEARQAIAEFEAHGKSLNADWFTRALLATSLAAAGQYDSAHIEYARLIDDLPAPYHIGHTAAVNALRAGRFDVAKRFDTSLADPAAARRKGELVVFVSSGLIPQKISGDLFVTPTTRLSFPYYPDFTAPPVRVAIDGTDGDSVATVMVDVARRSLAARGKALAARQVLRAGAKHELGRAAAREDEVLGVFVKAMLVLLEQADTRSWETLPATLTLVKVPLPAGTHDVNFTVYDGRSARQVALHGVTIEAGKPTFRRFHAGR